MQLVDLTEVSLNTAPLCGSELPRPFYSASGLITVRFVSNGSIADSGYSAISRFVECTEGLWIVTEFGEVRFHRLVDVTCLYFCLYLLRIIVFL